MTNMAKIVIPAVDDITTFMGNIPEPEYNLRRRIRACRNAACYKLVNTESPHARALCNLVTEVATYWIYRPAPLETLEKAATYMMSLIKSADQVEELAVLA